MSGPAGYSVDGDLAEQARARLDAAAAASAAAAQGRRSLLAELLAMVPESSWIAAGCRSMKQWLLAYTDLSGYEAMRFEETAVLCHHHPELADALLSGEMPMRRAWVLARVVTAERAPYLGAVVGDLVQLSRDSVDDDGFKVGVMYWVQRVDELLAPRRVQKHSLSLHPSIFGGGEAHAYLGPAAFAAFCAAIDAYTQDPDPKDAPYQRTLSERRADALDDISHAALAGLLEGEDPLDHSTDADDDVDFPEHADPTDDEDLEDGDVDDGEGDLPGAGTSGWTPTDDGDEDGAWDGFAPSNDVLDELLDLADEADDGAEVDVVDALRRRIRMMEKQRRRRMRRKTKMRSGATINAIVDVRTLLGLRDRPDGGIDFDGFVMRSGSDRWQLTRQLLERLVCDSALLATLFDGPRRVLDANAKAEQFSRAQRRALAARDGCCVFPGCTRPPRHCDAHHLEERARHGPTTVANGALLCRFHHRLLHEHRWRLQIRDDRWVAIDPHGQIWTGRPAPPGLAAA